LGALPTVNDIFAMLTLDASPLHKHAQRHTALHFRRTYYLVAEWEKECEGVGRVTDDLATVGPSAWDNSPPNQSGTFRGREPILVLRSVQ